MTGDYLSTNATTSSARYREEVQRRRELVAGELGRIFAESTSRFTWEVGCGHGHFLSAYAQAHPEKLCLGIDVVSERIERALRKRDRARLENLFFIRAEARLFLEALPSSAAFDEMFILFPDPWPKLRHQKHRILQSEFLSAAAPRALANSRLCFRTDHAPYFQQAQDTLGRHPQWRPSVEPWPFEFCTVFQSRATEFHSLIGRRTGQL